MKRWFIIVVLVAIAGVVAACERVVDLTEPDAQEATDGALSPFDTTPQPDAALSDTSTDASPDAL